MTHFTAWTKRAGAAAAVATVFAGASLAQPKVEGRAAVLQRLMDCRAIADDGQRLACFDAAAGQVDKAEAAGDIVVVDRAQARTVRRQAFGFSLPSMSMFERGEKPEEIDRISAEVATARQNGAGKWTLKLSDGSVWSQIDVTPVGRSPKAGMKVEVRRASLGSYMISVAGQRAFRAHRDE